MMRAILRFCLPPASLAAATPVFAVDIERWETEGGARVLFVEARELPIVDVRLTFDAGAARDEDQPGLASMTSNLLLEGTEELSAGEVGRRFEDDGAQESTGSARDMGIVSLRSLSRAENLERVVDHLGEVLANPSFPEDALERVRSQMLIGLRRDRQSASSMGAKAFAEALYPDHPYGSPVGGTDESLQAIDRAAVKGFHERYYAAGNATIAIVGDLDREQAESIATALSEALPEGEPAPPLPEVPELERGEVVRIPFDSGQVHVFTGQPAVARGDDAYYPLYMGSHILGGSGLVSVLAKELREKRGLSYSSSSSVAPAAREGRFQMTTQVRADAVEEALTVLRDSLARLRQEGPTEEEMEDSRRNITGGFPLNLDSNRDLVGYLGMIGFYDLPLDYLDRFPERIAALEAEDVRGALHRRRDPARMPTVLVGPESAIEGVGD